MLEFSSRAKYLNLLRKLAFYKCMIIERPSNPMGHPYEWIETSFAYGQTFLDQSWDVSTGSALSILRF